MQLVIALVGSLIFGGGAGALTAMLILKSGGAPRPAPFPQQGFAPPQPQQFPPQQGFEQPPQGSHPPQ
ncbi:hypothetical protein [Saccharopolyspora shandongensis]|uniref:hypothetical protein n=1 Tax=Saccharopolyspora shandongensis TaxID=418495 RepID=UPI003F4D5C6B